MQDKQAQTSSRLNGGDNGAVGDEDRFLGTLVYKGTCLEGGEW